jgi:DNA invertase Pin-like site-specific DNA recombinase
MSSPLLYLRTSTKDQNPELQLNEGVEFCKRIGLDEPIVYQEKGSAYKLEKIRPIWESVLERAKKEKRDIVVWKYDRAFRNRPEFFKFMKVTFEVYGTKVYSVTEPSILNLWDMIDKSNTGNIVVDEFMKGMLKVMWDFMIQQAGEQAEEESRKKSDRVRLAVRKEGGITKSYKGNKWGRKTLKLNEEIMNLYNQGKSMRQIRSEVHYYDKNNNKKNVSLGYVHKIVSNLKGKNEVVNREFTIYSNNEQKNE